MEYLILVIILAVLNEFDTLSPDILKYDQYMKDFEITGRRMKQEAEDKRLLDGSVVKRESPRVAGKRTKQNQMKKQKGKPKTDAFRGLVEEGGIYVDKTDLILQLIQSEDHRVFISRPRRFGKSFLLDTIKEIFLGNKELFKGRQIFTANYDWKKYPILSFDFSEFYNKPVNALKMLMEVEKEIWRFGNASQIPNKEGNLQERLQYYLQYVYNYHNETRGTVVLIDEYDIPLLDDKIDPKIIEECQKILRVLFDVFKKAPIRFMIITGVSMTSLTPVCDYMNEIRDITMDQSYSTLLGYTENEYKTNFDVHLKEIIEERNVSEDVITNEIQFMYNGYRFSEKNETVHNPFSLAKYFDTKEAKNYFIDLEFPVYLVHQIWRRFREAISLSLRSTVDSKILKIHYNDVYKIPLITLLFRTGYLTIKEYYPARNVYEVDFPNEETRETYINGLMKEFGAYGWETTMEQRDVVRENLENIEIFEFIKNFQLEFHRALEIFVKLGKEDAFAFVFRIVLSLCTLKTVEIKETPLPLGRSDFVSILPKVCYIFELQMPIGTNFTMSEADVQKYTHLYGEGCVNVVSLSMTFNPRTCSIDEWYGTKYEDGKKITDYFPTMGFT